MSRIRTGEILFNRYRVDEFIAAGSMGAVYKVWDQSMNVYLAMKALHADLAEDEANEQGFKREVAALSKLAHPNIVPFYGLEQDEDSLYMLQKFINGSSLKYLIEKRKEAFSLEETLTYMKALYASLGYAHVKGVVHCDVKPGNVLIDETGLIYLSDFGIARHMDSTLTSLLTGAGTPAYMSPEQVKNKPVTPATDVYALGIITFELLTGQRPFTGKEPGMDDPTITLSERVKKAQIKAPPPNPHSLNPSIPEAVANVILKAMEKQPKNRYASTQEFFAALCQAAGYTIEQVPNRISVPARGVYTPPTPLPTGYPLPIPQPKPSTNRNKVVYTILVVVVVALLVIFVVPKITNPPAAALPPSVGGQETTREQETPVTQTPTATPQPIDDSITDTPVAIPTTATPTSRPVAFQKYKWQTRNVNLQQVAFSSLLMTSSGNAYIAYNPQGNLVQKNKMFRLSGNVWRNLSLPTNSNDHYIVRPDLAERRDGILFLSYYDLTDHFINFIYSSTAAADQWKSSSSAITDVNPANTVIGFDDLNHPVIAFLDNNDGYIKYAVYTGSNWEFNGIEKALSGGAHNAAGGFSVALASDKNGGLHLTYPSDTGLRYVYIKGQSTAPVTVDSGSAVGLYPGIAVDDNGKVYISYYDSKQGVLKLASGQGKNWTSNVVDSSGNVGQFSSVAVDDKGTAHISYYDVSAQKLKYVRVSGNQKDTPIYADPETGTGTWSSIALDPNGLPCISYAFLGENNSLRYAWAAPAP